MSDEPQDDIRASLASAMAADASTSEPAPSVTPETSAVEPIAADSSAPAPAEVEDKGTSEPARDEKGRFAPKQDTAPTDSPEPAKAETPVAPVEDQPAVKADAGKPPVAPPRDWTDAAKVKWQRLPREVQEELVKVDTRGRYGALNEIIEPYRQKFALKGQAPEQAIGALVAAWDGLENPASRVDTLKWLASSYGVDLSKLYPPANGHDPASPANPAGEPEYVDPQVAALRDELSGLKQQQAQFISYSQAQAQAQEEQRRTTIANEVATFRSSPDHPHFDIVEQSMSRLLRVDPEMGLQEAYETAVAANKTLRTAMEAERLAAEQQRFQAEAKQRVERARAASGSVTGSPTPGASVSATPNSDLRAMIAEQVHAAARV